MRFLTALDPGASRFTFQTFDDDKKREDKKLVRVLHGTLAQHHVTLKRLNAKGAGVYVTINATDLKGRKRANIKRVRALFVDLDGAPLEPVTAGEKPPHIVVESSPGKWHVYWRVKGLPLDHFEGAQKALIERFNSDPIVHDLPRVMRLPGYMHRKGKPFASRIVKTTDRVEYAADEYEHDTGEEHISNDELKADDPERVARALAVIPNNYISFMEWKRILMAAWAATGGSEAGFDMADAWSQKWPDYNAADTRKEWDALAGSPPTKIGMGTLVRLANKAAPGWDKRATFDDFYAYLPQHNYIYMPTREPWPATSVNSQLSPVPRKSGKPIKANVWLDKNRPVEQMGWAPGEPELIAGRLISDGGWIEKLGANCLNLYRPPTIEHGDASKAAPWVGHVRKLYGAAAAHIINYLAQRVQQPELKPSHALVLGGGQGIGKDTLLEPVKRAVGPWNFAEVSPQQLLGRFNGFIKSVVLRISEARDLGEVNRYQFYEHMKNYAAAPPDVLRCDEKHLREHSVLNCCGVVITTNYKTTGLYLPADDRRHYVAWSDLTREDFEDGYWPKLWRWYGAGGYGHVAAYLNTLVISKFDPKAPPAKTRAWWEIVNANQAPEDNELASMFDALGQPDAVTIKTIAKKASKDLAGWLTNPKNRRALPDHLALCNYTAVKNPDAKDGMWRIGGEKQMVYALDSLSGHDKIIAARKLK